MSKGLEELKRLAYENACYICQYYIEKKCTNKGECVWKTIEQELQDLDTIKEIFSDYGLEYKPVSVREALLLLKQYQGSHGVRGQALITKKLQALEIIGKKINATTLIHYFGYLLDEEDKDLLKEVLL